MKHGILEEWDEKKVQSAVKEDVPITIGVSAESLLQDIEIGMVQTGYNPTQVLANIHKDLLVLTGKVVIQKPVEVKK